MVDNDSDIDDKATGASPKEDNLLLPSARRGSLTASLCLFSIAYFIVIVLFFFTRGIKVGKIRLQDVLTMLTPLLVVPLMYRVALIDPETQDVGHPPWTHHLVFLLGVVIYVHGDGMHLAANAIHRYDESIVDEDALDVVEFYDEELGHYYPYAGLLLLHVICVIRQFQWPFVEEHSTGWGSRLALLFAGTLHGLTLFISFVEGRFAIPAIVFFVILLAVLMTKFRRLVYDPVSFFSFVYSAVGLLLFIIWAVWQGGLPELTESGII